MNRTTQLPRIFFTLGFAAVGCAPSVSPQATSAEKTAALYAMNADRMTAALEVVYARNLMFTPPGRDIREFDFFDFDHTLADTDTMVPVKSSTGADRLEDSKCLRIDKGDVPDYNVFSRQELYAAAPIPETIKRAKEYTAAADTQVAVITARGQTHTFNSIFEYTAQRGAEVDIVLPIHADLIQKALWDKMTYPSGVDGIPSGMKKALFMAALIDLAQMRGGTIRTARYFEDTDSYFRAAMEFLPARYPAVRWEFYDIIRAGTEKHRTYTERFAGVAEKGSVHEPGGETLKASAYSSGDCPGM